MLPISGSLNHLQSIELCMTIARFRSQWSTVIMILVRLTVRLLEQTSPFRSTGSEAFKQGIPRPSPLDIQVNYAPSNLPMITPRNLAITIAVGTAFNAALVALGFTAPQALAQEMYPNQFMPTIPSDCDWVERFSHALNGTTDFLYFQTCVRGRKMSEYVKLEGVSLIKDNVIYVPKQSIGGRYSNTIEGYMCAGAPPYAAEGMFFTCKANGWTRTQP